MRAIGVDLSLRATGVSDGLETWLIPSTGKEGDTLASRCRRLQGLAAQVLQHCYEADLVVIEQPAYSKTTGHMHDRSGLWWLVVGQIHDRGTPVAEVPPSTLKKYATGAGNCGKGAMTDAAARRLPQVHTAGNDNRIDALWLAAMGLDRLGTPVAEMPAAHRAALEAVKWPNLADG